MVRKQLTRKGKCTPDCPLIVKCCGSCPWYVKQKGVWHCKDYANAPLECRLFPIDEYERRRIGKECSFFWEGEESVEID